MTTTYTVTYTLSGCTSSAQTGTVTVNPVPTVVVADQSICQGASTTLVSTPTPPGGTYSWSPGGATSSSITVSPGSTTNYTLVYTQGGCASAPDVSIVTVNPAPIVSVMIVSNQITADQSGALYQWVDCNSGYSAIGGATNQMYVPTANGNYAVHIILNGCVDTSACNLISTTGIDAADNFSSMAYPNPTSGIIYISAWDKADPNYEITDLMGKVVFSGKLSSENPGIDISDLSNGIYFFKAGIKNSKLFKIIKN
jgi:hypothetical protein